MGWRWGKPKAHSPPAEEDGFIFFFNFILVLFFLSYFYLKPKAHSPPAEEEGFSF